MKGKVKGKIIALASLALATTITFTVAGTAAAFFNYELHNQEIVIDMGYGKYFGGGDGSQASPYLIGSSEHLRNLSKLTAMGVLGKNDYFQLSQDITYAGEPLFPIGTFHSPFYGQFDGKDHTITSLVVTGTDQQDVGMFGYAAVGSSIKNFKLNSPVINAVTSASMQGKHTYATMDNNILRASLTEGFVKSFDLYPANLTQVNEYVSTFTQFAIKYSDKDAQGNSILPAGFKLSYSISDSFIKEASVTLPAGSQPKANETAIGFQFDSAVLDKTKFAVIDFFIEGVIENAGVYRYARFNIERFKIYGVVGKDKKGNEVKYLVQKDVDGNDWKKLIHAKPDIVESTPGVFQYDYIEHKKYVGIIVGNLEGDIDRILVYSPKMVITGGPFASNSYLVGNHIDDNRKSPLSKHKIDCENLSNVTLSYKTVDDPSLGFKNVEEAKIFLDRGDLSITKPTYNYVIPEIYNEGNRVGMISPKSKNAIRLFGTNNVSPANQQVKINSVNYKTTTKDDSTPTNRTALSITGDMSGQLAYFNTPNFISEFKKVPSCSAMVISNAFQFWATATEDTKGIWQKLFFGNKASFTLDIELDYVYFDQNFNNQNQTTFEEENKLALLEIEKKDSETIPTGFLRAAESVYTLPDGYSYSQTNEPSPGTLLPMNNVGGAKGLPNEYQAIEPKAKAGNVNLDANGNYPLRFLKEDIAAPKANANKTHEIKTKDINLTVNMPNTGAPLGDDKNTHTPLFLFGMQTGTLKKKYQLDIYGLRITISDKAGNFAATVLNIDYTGDTNATIPATADFQAKSTKTRVKTTLYDDIKELNTNTDTSPLLVNPAAANGCGTYIIQVTRGSGSSKTVTVKYKTTQAIKDAKKIPTNVKGFTDATIRSDNNLTV